MAEIKYIGGHWLVSETVSNGDSLTFDAGQANSAALEVHTIAHSGDCDVLLEVDSDNDGTFDQSVTLDSFTGSGVSAGNEIEVLETNSMRLKIDNTSGSSQDYIVTGVEL